MSGKAGWTWDRPCEPLPERIRRCSTKNESGCWIWNGALKSNGYAQILVGRRNDGTRRKVYAHRVSYETYVGPIPDGLVIDHLCRTRSCVNPDHLEPVTTRENLLRGEGFVAVNAAKTHCKWGHEYTPENTIRERLGRKCRACKQERERKAYAAKCQAQRIH